MFNKVGTFFREVKVELKKVAFPSRDEVISSTWVVIITTVSIALILGAVDILLTKLVGMAIG